ncbi:hypothetical protein [Saccharopolyspora phatthalungensis]|uniref:Uncharacterized protein n=1 Tax=Saccharopolyspora phatthalungensis TaxID=664693 RepID=A0A840Q060_9PSEU|nr:hypothetical protein [Saccharopolyspora phatthalungensis]MBB5152891.1 hypothetical protein [Saccharopolyspora phatthalungensis]
MPEADVLLDADALLEELESLRERRDEAIEANADFLYDPARQVQDISSEVDDRLAESDFTMVEQSVRQAIDIINDAGDDAQLDELCRLAAIRLPGDTEPELVEEPDLSAFHRIIEPELPKPSGTEPRPSGDDEDVFIDELRNRRDTCAHRIRALLDHFVWDLWPKALEYAGEGNVNALKAMLEACEALAADLREAYELWILWLNELYTDYPSHLGTVGEVTHAWVTWLVNHHRPPAN